MNLGNGHPLEPAELLSLPPEDPRRAAFLDSLRTAAPEEQLRWDEEFAWSDRLRTLLAEVDLPSTLQGHLLGIPEGEGQPTADQPRSRHALLQMRIDWRAAAACLVLLGAVAAWWMLRTPAKLPQLDGKVAQTIAAWAVEHHAGTLDVTSTDPVEVEKALAGKTDVPVIMLTPADGATLAGGGTCRFGDATAVYTQWRLKGATYTLYEFNGKKLGAPEKFYASMQSPTELWHDTFQYRVFIFPGSQGACCWALVMESDRVSNPFAQYGSSY